MSPPASASTSASVEVGAVVDRRGPDLDREPTPGPGPSWLPCTRRPEPGGPARLEDGPATARRRRRRLAEDVDPAAVRRAGGEHLAAHERDVVVGAASNSAGRRGRRGRSTSSVSSRGELAGAPLGGDVEPVAGLDLDVGDPGAEALARRARRERAELVVARRAGRLGRDPDAARLVGAAGHPRRELRGAVAGEDQVRVAVDEAGHHAAAAGVDAVVGLRAGRLDRGDAAVVEDERGVADDAQRPLAERRVVGDEQADVVDRERGHPAAIQRGDRGIELGATSIDTWAPPRRTRPPTTTLLTSAAAAAKTTDVERKLRRGAGEPRRRRARR